TLVLFYHRNELITISRFAKKTKEFITHQQDLLAQDLRDVDEKVASIKVGSGGMDEGSTSQFMESKMQSDLQINEINNAMASISSIRQNAKSGSKVISTAGVDDPVLTGLITE